MKKLLHIFSAFVILSSVFIGFRSGQNAKIAASNLYVKAVNVIETSTQQNYPEQFYIPSLSLIADIEDVGKGEDGRMDVPKDEDNVGWWTYGAKPGEIGSMVLAGHIDRREGGPGIFYDLNNLKVGETVKISDKKGRVYVYEVVDRAVYKDNEFPIEKVFAKSDKSRLNLITCTGFFDSKERNYTERLVVYTELVDVLKESR